MRILIVCSDGLTETCNRVAFCLRLAGENTMRSPVSSVSGKKQPQDARVLEHREGINI